MHVCVCICVECHVSEKSRTTLCRICLIREIKVAENPFNPPSMQPADPLDTSMEVPPTVCLWEYLFACISPKLHSSTIVCVCVCVFILYNKCVLMSPCLNIVCAIRPISFSSDKLNNLLKCWKAAFSHLVSGGYKSADACKDEMEKTERDTCRWCASVRTVRMDLLQQYWHILCGAELLSLEGNCDNNEGTLNEDMGSCP